ncbi:MAG: MFS transporter [Burkholderiales bacterium]|nr:MFS transporter [Burkholderiales bacterium]
MAANDSAADDSVVYDTRVDDAAPPDAAAGPPPAALGPLPRELFVLVALLVIAHTALNGIRVATSLAAIKAGGGALWVGLLTAMFNLVPAFIAIRVGRLVDRVPLRRMMVVGCVVSVAGGLLAALLPMLGILAFSACALGVGWMMVAAAAQYAVGLLGHVGVPAAATSEQSTAQLAAQRAAHVATQRVRAFSVLAMGFSLSAFFGPLIAGFMIDHVSFQAAFALLAALPLIPAVAFALGHPLLPAVERRETPPGNGARELLAMPSVRNTLISASFITVGWDLYGFMVPVLGSELMLTATQIGSVMSVFAAAVFAIRFFMARLTHRYGEVGVMVGAMTIAGVTFLAFAFAHSYALMLVLSFAMGIGLGASQPIVLSLLHNVSPPGRIGEVNGMRMTMISTSQWTMPLVFGSLSAFTGLLPLFVVIGGGILGGSWFARRNLPRV